jgi:hypothetical protein
MTQASTPPLWNAAFEEQLFLEVARRHVAGFPDRLAAPPREPRTDAEIDAVCDYYTRMASHDLFIVQVVARAIDTLFADDPHFQLILARQLGDDGAHATLARERIVALTSIDPLPAIQRRVDEHWQRLGNLPLRDIAGFLAFEWHYELHILAKLWIQRKTGTIADAAMREHGENRIRPDEEWHRVQIIEWWRALLAKTPAGQRDALIARVLAADDDFQRRLDGYLHDEYAHTARVFGADIAAYRAIYNDWRREILARLTQRDPATLSALASLSTRRSTEHA